MLPLIIQGQLFHFETYQFFNQGFDQLFFFKFLNIHPQNY